MGLKLNIDDVIKYCAYETMNNGYVKRSDSKDEDCTADKVIEQITKDLVPEVEFEKVKDRVAKWLDYINEQSGDYFENVKIEICKPSIDEMKVGLIASSFAMYDRFVSFEKSNECEKNSVHLGEEGDTIEFIIGDHKFIKSGINKFGNGTSNKWYMYKIHDNKNNVIVFFADHDCEFEFNHSSKAKASISKLNDYNGIKQTVVSKLRFLDE